MSKTKDYLETWSTKNRKTGKRTYYCHRVYANRNVGESQKWASRSGRSSYVRKQLAKEPSLKVIQRLSGVQSSV